MLTCSEKGPPRVVFVTGCLMAGHQVGGPPNQGRSGPSNTGAPVTNSPAIPAGPRATRGHQRGWGCAAEGLSKAGSPVTGGGAVGSLSPPVQPAVFADRLPLASCCWKRPLAAAAWILSWFC